MKQKRKPRLREIELSPKIARRLDVASEKSGKSTDEIINEAISRHLPRVVEDEIARLTRIVAMMEKSAFKDLLIEKEIPRLKAIVAMAEKSLAEVKAVLRT